MDGPEREGHSSVDADRPPPGRHDGLVLAGGVAADDYVQGLSDRWNLLVEHIPDIIIIAARDGTILAINRSVIEVTVGEVVGTSVRDYIVPESHGTVMGSIEQAFLTGELQTYEIRGDGANGPGSAWYEGRSLPLEHDGRVVAVMQIATDVTERKRAQEEEARLQQELREKLEAERDVLAEEVTRLRGEVQDAGSFENIIGRTPVMTALFETMLAVSQTHATVLIQGETGTGKELVARAIHFNGPRRDEALVKIDCGALVESLLESELFGHVKGAFTGAMRGRVGRFEAADGGTVFLDEIHNLSVALQAKLLRVLQDGTFEPVGSSDTRRADVRVIGASNEDMVSLVAEGLFRKDLYYRLNVVSLHIPPLRERTADIPLMVEHFMRRLCEVHGTGMKGVDRSALEILMDHTWPGNVRELENVLERAVILCRDGTVRADDIHFDGPPSDTDVARRQVPFYGVSLAAEKQMLVHALERAAGNKKRAARQLDISRSTLYVKLKKHGLLYGAAGRPSAD